MRWNRTPAMVFAGIGFVAAAAIFGSTLVDAVRVDASPVEPAGAVPQVVGVAPAEDASTVENLEAWIVRTSGSGVAPEEMNAAVSQDLFLPDRSAPSERYRLPGEPVAPVMFTDEELPQAPDFRVVGTAVIPPGGLALIQLGSELPIALSLGESLLGYELTQVGADVAFLEGAAGTLRLLVTEAQFQSADDRRGRDRRGDNEQDAAAALLDQRTQQVQQMLRQFQMGGGRGGVTMGRGRGGGGGQP